MSCVVTGLGPVNVGGLDDDELVRLARAGHQEAFDAIVHRYRAPLLSYCRRWVDPHRAEEVVQHTLMKAFLCLRDDDRPLALRPWLYRVAHNASLNTLEKKGSDWEELDENYDGVPQPPQVAEKRARFLQVVHEIEELPLRQREALILNEFEGRCYADIAEQLGTSESGVRGLLRRARRQLRETAAAILLPFPALRELVRSDPGRSFQTERAGELIGSAGAAGGLSAAGGGFAKIAAGVLAAGTIAGGGTALEHSQFGKTPDAKAQGVVTHTDPTETSKRLVASGGDLTGNAVSESATSGSRGGARLSVDEYSDDSIYDGATFYTFDAGAEMGAALEDPEPEPAPESESEEDESPIEVLVPEQLAPERDEPEDDEEQAQAPKRQTPPSGNGNGQVQDDGDVAEDNNEDEDDPDGERASLLPPANPLDD